MDKQSANCSQSGCFMISENIPIQFDETNPNTGTSNLADPPL